MKTRIIEAIYSFGAVLVIGGCWQKIEHMRLADTFLTIGLLTECGIFALYGFQALTSKSQAAIPAHSEEYPTQERLEALIGETNAILRDVYKTKK